MRATNETRKPTATPNGKTAGKTAKKNNTRRVWRTVATKRGTALRSPDGRLYYGTAAEVRDAALMPDRRNSLAQSLQLARHLRCAGTLDAAECRAMCEDRRREAIQYGAADAKISHSIFVSAKAMIMLKAGARFMGYTFDEYEAELAQSQITSFQEAAQIETGKLEIPLTRHERAALARLAAQA